MLRTQLDGLAGFLLLVVYVWIALMICAMIFS